MLHDLGAQLLTSLELGTGEARSTRSGAVNSPELMARMATTVFDCLSRPSALATNVRLLRDGREVSRDLWLSSRMSHGNVIHTSIVAPYLDRALSKGDLLVIDSIDECDTSMMALRESLEYGLSARVWINVYLTANEQSSFGVHSDDMSTIIIQLLGRKRWQVVEGSNCDRDDFDVRSTTLELIPGGVLFVPAHTLHDVVGVGRLTAHLTVGFDQHAGLDRRISELANLLGREVRPVTGAELSRGKAMLADRRVGSTLPFRISGDPDHCRQIRWSSRLPPIVRGQTDVVEVISMGQTFRFHRKFSSVLEALASGRPFELEELVSVSEMDRETVLDFLMKAIDADLVLCRGPCF
jgi:hypothetical protein